MSGFFKSIGKLYGYVKGLMRFNFILFVFKVALIIFAMVRGRLTIATIGLKSAVWVVPYLVGLVLISYLGGIF